MRRRLADAAAAALAGGLAFGVAGCGDSAEPAPLRDPAAAASAAIDERALQPHERADLDTSSPGDAPSDGDPPGDQAALSDGSETAGTDVGSGLDDTPPTSLVGEVVAHYDLGIDDCFDRVEAMAAGRSRATITRLPCSRPHMYQVFGRAEHPAQAGAAYPGDTAISDFALQACYRLFGHWADSVYETSALQIEALTPELDDFTDDAFPYRGIHCLVRRADGEPLTGTARSSGL